MIRAENVGAVYIYIYIYIVRTNEINLNRHRIKEAMYFRRL